jgi:hypothetical protein
MRSLTRKNATQNTFYKAIIVFWYLKIKSEIQVRVVLYSTRSILLHSLKSTHIGH